MCFNQRSGDIWCHFRRRIDRPPPPPPPPSPQPMWRQVDYLCRVCLTVCVGCICASTNSTSRIVDHALAFHCGVGWGRPTGFYFSTWRGAADDYEFLAVPPTAARSVVFLIRRSTRVILTKLTRPSSRCFFFRPNWLTYFLLGYTQMTSWTTSMVPSESPRSPTCFGLNTPL